MSVTPLDVGLRRVQQEDAQGCGVATLAMLTSQSYRAVRDDLEAYGSWLGHSGDWDKNGLTAIVLDRYLGERGFYTQIHYRAWHEDRKVEGGAARWVLRPGAAWPPAPFAPVHYASVEQPSGNGHFVVVEHDGTVLDPFREGRFTLRDWPGVNYVVGLLR